MLKFIFCTKSFTYLCIVIKRKDGLWIRFLILRMVGCRLVLLGPLFRKKSLKDLANLDEYPYIIVWEDYATVLRKLSEAGWGQ